MGSMIYLDHAATTPMRPGVWEAMSPYASDAFGNSSGVHEVSRRAKNALEEARERIASLIAAKPSEIVFTSGGTESDNLALKGAAWSSDTRTGIISVATEHEAVLETADLLNRFGDPVYLASVDHEGRPDLDEVLGVMNDNTVLVSMMLVNNETGLVNDVGTASAKVKAQDAAVLFHTDAVQAFSSRQIDVEELGIDLLSLTAHKFGGPKGSGLLYVREGTVLEPLLHGGGQELGRRSGTHDVAGVVGLAEAMARADAEREGFVSEVGALRDRLEERLIVGIPGLVVNTPESDRSPQHLNVTIPGVSNETLLLRLDQSGVAASAGSACQSGASEVSHVLEAMGRTPQEARESVRFTLGWTTTEAEIEAAAAIVIDLAEELR